MPSSVLRKPTRLTGTGTQISRNIAAVLGGFLATVALCVLVTLVWPFGDRIEQIFAGGIFFFVLWSTFFYWALLARTASLAWMRVGALTLLFGLLDSYLLFVGSAS